MPVATTLATLREQRLEAQLAELDKLLAFYSARAAMPSAPPMAAIGIQQARDSLAAARQAKNRMEAWAHCHQAFRFLLYALTPDELEDRRRLLRDEAEAKLSDWRLRAVQDVLGRNEQPPRAATADMLALTQFLFDQHFGNVYFKLDAVAIRLGSLRWVLLVLVVAAVFAAWMLPDQNSDSALFQFERTCLVLMVGAIGAAISNAISVLGVGSRIPGLLGENAHWFVRLPLGALTALAIVVMVQSGIVPLLQPTTDLGLYAWALVGGYSDQLLNKVIAKVEKSIDP